MSIRWKTVIFAIASVRLYLSVSILMSSNQFCYIPYYIHTFLLVLLSFLYSNSTYLDLLKKSSTETCSYFYSYSCNFQKQLRDRKVKQRCSGCQQRCLLATNKEQSERSLAASILLFLQYVCVWDCCVRTRVCGRYLRLPKDRSRHHLFSTCSILPVWGSI